MRRLILVSLSVVALVATSNASVAQVSGGGAAVHVRPAQLPIYDYWVTSTNTSVDLNVPAGFFGDDSDPLNVTVALTGQPFGPGGGAGLSPTADTSVHRKKNPNLPSIGSSDTVGIRMKGLSLASIAPVTVTYNGEGDEQWDVHVGLSDVAPQVWGSLTATKTYSGGGTFDSSMTVIPKFTFTRVSNGSSYVLDVGNPSWGIPASTITAVDTDWITSLPGHSGNFHPGYSAGPSPSLIYYITQFSQNCAQHQGGPCTTCPDDWGPIEPGEVEPTEN